jgi:hypothetical protein
MNYKKIQELLDKYWNCETTLEEEEILRSYFSNEEVHDDFKEFEQLFRHFNEVKGSRVSNDFDERIFEKVKKRKAQRRHLGFFTKVAAAVILILSFVVINQRYILVKDKATQVVQDTFEDPHKALEETKKMLMLVSEKWNKGKVEISKISEFNKAEKMIRNKNLKEI